MVPNLPYYKAQAFLNGIALLQPTHIYLYMKTWFTHKIKVKKKYELAKISCRTIKKCLKSQMKVVDRMPRVNAMNALKEAVDEFEARNK
jgi:hypothetical protein